MLPMRSAEPCAPVAAPVALQKQTPVVAGSEDADDEVVAVPELEDAKVAAEMNALIVG